MNCCDSIRIQTISTCLYEAPSVCKTQTPPPCSAASGHIYCSNMVGSIRRTSESRWQRGSWCLVLMTVCLGLICALLLAYILLQHITITAERDLLKSYTNTVQEFNQTINSLKGNNTNLMIEKAQLQNNFSSLSRKKLELETRVNSLTAEKSQLQRSVDSLSQKKLELETKVNSLTAEKSQLQRSVDSLSQKKLELETRVNNLTAEKNQLQNSLNSSSQKNLQLETRVNNLTAEKNQLNRSVDSLSQKKLELETRVKNLTAEKNQLQNSLNSSSQKNLQLETKVNSLTAEKSQLQRSVDSLSQKNLELETRVNSLTAEKSQLQNNLNSLNQKNLELESKVTSLNNELQKVNDKGNRLGWFFLTPQLSWSASRQYCKDRGGDLIILNTEVKQVYGSRSIAARIASYETTSALVSRSSPEVGMATRHTPSSSDSDLPSDKPQFLRAGVPLKRVSRHVVVSTDASATGWGAMCNGHAAAGSRTGPQRLWHVNCLELLAVRLALHRLLRGQHVLVRSDNTATVAYINRQGGLRSRRMSQLARHLLIWSQKHLRSLRAIYIPGDLNHAAVELSRLRPLPGEWRLHPQSVQLIWDHFGDAQVDLFASHDFSHCNLFYSLTEGTLGTDALAHSWPRGLRKYAFPPVSLQTLRKIREDEEQDEAGLSTTITSARASSTRHAYALKWNLFINWCSSRREDPTKCQISVVLSFLQEELERRPSPSTLKVYVAAIAAHHDAVEVVLTALQSAPFEPLQSVELKFLLVALASIKRVGDLQAFSVDEACLEFGPANSHVILRPRPGYVPKVPTTPF
ncbi:unnamed protein product [Leuciscus chuanchicus]